MATSQNVEISKKGYAAFGAGDIETVLSDYDDDVEFVVRGNSAISGTYRGKAGVAELFAKVAERSFAIVHSRFLADDDVVVVLSQVTAGGESAPEADVFTFRDGKIVNAQNFGDTAMLNGSSARSSRGRTSYRARRNSRHQHVWGRRVSAYPRAALACRAVAAEWPLRHAERRLDGSSLPPRYTA